MLLLAVGACAGVLRPLQPREQRPAARGAGHRVDAATGVRAAGHRTDRPVPHDGDHRFGQGAPRSRQQRAAARAADAGADPARDADRRRRPTTRPPPPPRNRSSRRGQGFVKAADMALDMGSVDANTGVAALQTADAEYKQLAIAIESVVPRRARTPPVAPTRLCAARHSTMTLALGGARLGHRRRSRSALAWRVQRRIAGRHAACRRHRVARGRRRARARRAATSATTSSATCCVRRPRWSSSLRGMVRQVQRERRLDPRGEHRSRQRQPRPEPAHRADGVQPAADRQLDGAAHRHRAPERRLGRAGQPARRLGLRARRSAAAPWCRRWWRPWTTSTAQLQADRRHHRRHRRHRLPDQHPGAERRGRSRARRRTGPRLRGRGRRGAQPGAALGRGRQGDQGADRRLASTRSSPAPSWCATPARRWTRSSPACSASPTSSARSPPPPAEQSDGIGQVNGAVSAARPDDAAERRAGRAERRRRREPARAGPEARRARSPASSSMAMPRTQSRRACADAPQLHRPTRPRRRAAVQARQAIRCRSQAGASQHPLQHRAERRRATTGKVLNARRGPSTWT